MKPEFRRIVLALIFPLFLVFILYVMRILEVGMDWNFTVLGIYPLSIKGIIGILGHPLVHSSFGHLFANTFPLLFLSWCLFYFYRDLSWLILVFVWILEGVFTFLIGKPGWHVGASGLIYGLAFFLFFSGILRKHVPLIAISLLVTFLYGGLIWNMIPYFAEATTSWEGHLGGSVAGTLAAFAFKSYGPQKPIPFSDDQEEEDEEENKEEPIDEEGNSTP